MDLEDAVFYGRMSKDEQTESIPAQRAKTYACFDGKKYRIVAEYIDEGKSGSKDTRKRKSFLRMINDLTQGHLKNVKYVVCLDLSRFGRLDTIDGAEFKKALRESGVCLDTAIDGIIDWRKSMDRIVDAVRSEGNHSTSLLIGEKGLAGRIRVTLAGKPNGKTTYGMAKMVTTPSGEKIIVPRTQKFRCPKGWGSVFVPGDPSEVDAVKYMFTTYDEQDISFNEVARLLEERGFPYTGNVHQWQGQYVQNMLANPVYVGDLRIGDKPRGKFFRITSGKECPASQANPDEPAIIVPNTHEGIIDRSLFNRVQAKIARTTKSRRPPVNKGPYALSGIIMCGSCGKPMYGSKDRGGKRVIYRCHHAEVGPAKCGYWIAYEDRILPTLLGDFLSSIREEIARQGIRTTTVTTAELDAEMKALQDQMDALDVKLKNARARFLEASADVAGGLMITLEEWEAEKRSLQEKINARGKPKGTLLQEWWERFEADFFASNPISMPGQEKEFEVPRGKMKVSLNTLRCYTDEGLTVITTKVPSAVLREKLKQIGTTVTIWFRRATGRKGWDVDKIRMQATIRGEVVYTFDRQMPGEYDSNAEYSTGSTPILVERWYGPDDLQAA